MRADEARPVTGAGGDGLRARTGPRHAAPRKSLLHKLNHPAGKAVALAAVPTAVFVGMGLTPKLALADENGDVPFAAGPCATREDVAAEEKKKDDAAKAEAEEKKEKEERKEPAGAGGPDGTGPAAPDTAEPGPAATAPPAPGGAATGPEQSGPPAPEPPETRNPLDPLGVGDALEDLFDGPDEPAGEPSPPPPAEEPAGGRPAERPAEVPVEKPADPVEEAVKDAADQAGADVEELADEVKDTVDRPKDETGGELGTGIFDENGKERFPCPEADPEALAAAALEQGIPLLPDEPWKLETSLLTLRGLDYQGIVEVKTYTGKVKKVLKFTAKETDIKDLHQLTVGPEGSTGHVKAREGSTSTIRGGTVTMYTEELKGNLFGIVPVTFSPRTPPPLNVPFAFFTDAEVTQAAQFGGTLTVPGLRNYFTDQGLSP